MNNHEEMTLTSRYRKQVIKHYNHLSLTRPDIPLEQVFVKLNLETQEDWLSFEEKRAILENGLWAEMAERELTTHYEHRHQPQIITLSVAEALHQYRRLLVIGGPGSGKTTLTRWLALTFARNQQAEPNRLGTHFTQPRLPILLELRRFASRIKKLSEEPTIPDLAHEIANYISQHAYFVGVFAEFIHEQLAEGHCLLLIDGLDEISDLNARRKVIRAINAFFQRPDRSYRDNLCLITSRPLSVDAKLGATLAWRAHFKNAQILPFTIPDVRLALSHWYDTAYGTDAREEALNLLEAISKNERVADLATNPLLCTMIAIVYRNNRILPNRRASLYEEYCKALQKPHNHPSERYDWQTKLTLLATLAYWLHRRSRLAAPFDAFVSQLSQILIEKFLYSPTQAPDDARRFLVAIRDHTGLLQEGADGSLSFAHRTAQEYLVARYIAAQPQEQIIDLVMPHLHDAWWREVHLLVIAHLGSTSATARQASALLEQILTVYRPPWPFVGSYSPNLSKWCEDLEYLFKKEIEIDIKYIISVVVSPLIFVVVSPLIFFFLILQLISFLLVLLVHTFPKWQLTRRLAWALGREFELAAAGYAECAYTTKAIAQLLNDKATERLLYLMSESLYDTDEALDLQRSAKQIWENFGYDSVIDALLKALTNGQCHMRGAAARHLGQLGQANPVVVNALAAAVSDRDLSVRERAAESLVQLGEVKPEVVKPALAMLASRNHEVREAIISHLGKSEKISPQVISDLLAALTDSNWRVRAAAAHSLGQLGQATEQIVESLLERLTDKSSYVRRTAAHSLGKLGKVNRQVVEILLKAHTHHESRIREGAARGLRHLGFDTQVVKCLLAALADRESEVRKTAARSLGQLEAREQVVFALLTVLSDDEDMWVRQAAASSLGELGQASPQVISGLLAALSDSVIKTTAAASLIELDGTNPQIVERIQAIFPKWIITQTKIPTSECATLVRSPRLRGAASVARREIQDESMLYLSLVMTGKRLYHWDLDVNRMALEVIRKLVTGRPLPGYQWTPLDTQRFNRKIRKHSSLDLPVHRH